MCMPLRRTQRVRDTSPRRVKMVMFTFGTAASGRCFDPQSQLCERSQSCVGIGRQICLAGRRDGRLVKSLKVALVRLTQMVRC